ncbi:MAG: alpha/beta hydrolase [Anaerolineae bacterium]|nr:alpha/beta hydrolase [Anaerolineae bacterium]
MNIIANANSSLEMSATQTRQRGCLFYVKRGLLGILILLVVLPVTGILYEALMATGDADRYPAPGSLISVGDHKLHIQCIGAGSPTVVLESGFGSTSLDWLLVQPEVARFTRVCAYDRAGLAWSDPLPTSDPRSPGEIAAELHTLLGNAGIEPPYVLVGHSLGGKDVRMFAAQYPGEVVGMVLVDARHESLEPVRTSEESQKDREAYESSLGLYSLLRTIGVARVFGASLLLSVDPESESLPSDIRAQITVFGTRETTLNTMKAESAGSNADDGQLSTFNLGDIPLIVMPAGWAVENIPGWLEAQQKQAALSSNSRLEIVEGARHTIQWQYPDRVVNAIRELVDAVQAGQPLQ